MNETPLSVLICEDETILRIWLQRELQQRGYRVVGMAQDGLEAIEAAELLEPDLIVMDIKMPRCDGLTASTEIMNRKPTAILILTAYGESETVARALEIGVSGYLVKPVDSSQVGPALAMAHAKFSELMGLRENVASLEEALEQRKLLDRAKGILIRHLGIDEPGAHRLLQQLSNRQRTPLKQVLQGIIEADKAGNLAKTLNLTGT